MRRPQALQLLSTRLVQLLHRNRVHVHRVQRGVALHRLRHDRLVRHATTHTQSVRAHARNRVVLLVEIAVAQRLVVLHADRHADSLHRRLLLRTDALRLHSRVLLQWILQRALRTLLVQVAQTRVDRLNAVRVHPRLRVADVAVVVAQLQTTTLATHLPALLAEHRLLRLQLRLTVAARHQNGAVEILAVRLQRVVRSLIIVLLLTHRADRLVGTLFVHLHRRIVSNDGRSEVVHAKHTFSGKHETQIVEVLLFLAGDVVYGNHGVAVLVRSRHFTRLRVVVGELKSILFEHRNVRIQLVLRQVTQEIPWVSVRLGDGMVVHQTRRHSLHTVGLLCSIILAVHSNGSACVVSLTNRTSSPLVPSSASSSLLRLIRSRLFGNRAVGRGRWRSGTAHGFCNRFCAFHSFRRKRPLAHIATTQRCSGFE